MPGQLGARTARSPGEAVLSATRFAESEKEKDRHCGGHATPRRALVASHAPGRTSNQQPGFSELRIESCKDPAIKTVQPTRIGDATAIPLVGVRLPSGV